MSRLESNGLGRFWNCEKFIHISCRGNPVRHNLDGIYEAIKYETHVDGFMVYVWKVFKGEIKTKQIELDDFTGLKTLQKMSKQLTDMP